MPPFAALTALVVRRVSGDAALFMYCISGDTDRPCFARASRRTPPGGALACALGGGTLPPALVVRRVNGLAALFMYRISDLAALFVRCVNGVLALLHAAPR